jgi:hypothetical protein
MANKMKQNCVAVNGYVTLFDLEKVAEWTKVDKGVEDFVAWKWGSG